MRHQWFCQKCTTGMEFLFLEPRKEVSGLCGMRGTYSPAFLESVLHWKLNEPDSHVPCGRFTHCCFCNLVPNVRVILPWSRAHIRALTFPQCGLYSRENRHYRWKGVRSRCACTTLVLGFILAAWGYCSMVSYTALHRATAGLGEDKSLAI